MMTHIAGLCPACGQDELYAESHAAGGGSVLECKQDGCPDPGAAHRSLPVSIGRLPIPEGDRPLGGDAQACCLAHHRPVRWIPAPGWWQHSTYETCTGMWDEAAPLVFMRGGVPCLRTVSRDQRLFMNSALRLSRFSRHHTGTELRRRST